MLKYFNKIYRYPIINQAKLQKCFGSFNSHEKLIKIRGNFEKYDINSYFLSNNDEHHVIKNLVHRKNNFIQRVSIYLKEIKRLKGFRGLVVRMLMFLYPMKKLYCGQIQDISFRF